MKDMTSSKVSVVLPAYNEKDNIVLLIREIKNHLRGYSKEIWVVDDNSPDQTADIVKKEFSGDPEVNVLVRFKDKGFAKSIRAGIENSTGEIVLVMDSDFNHQPIYLPFMIDALAHYDVVLGSRFLYGGRMSTQGRHLLSWIFNVFVRLATGGRITDNLYGFFSIKRTILQECPFDEIFWGYGDYCIRLLYFLQRREMDILQFPAINGRRQAGVGNSAFFRVFRQYTAATLKLVIEGRLQTRVFSRHWEP